MDDSVEAWNIPPGETSELCASRIFRRFPALQTIAFEGWDFDSAHEEASVKDFLNLTVVCAPELEHVSTLVFENCSLITLPVVVGLSWSFRNLKHLIVPSLSKSWDDPVTVRSACVALARLSSLETLVTCQWAHTNESLAELAVLTSLRCLAAGGGNNLTQLGIQSLCKLTNLVDLQLGGLKCSGKDIVSLKLLKKLEVLEISSAPHLGDEVFPVVQTFSKLETLIVWQSPGITCRGLQTLTHLQHLKSIALFIEVDDEGWRALAGHKTLFHLQVRALKLEGEELDPLVSVEEVWLYEVLPGPLRFKALLPNMRLLCTELLHPGALPCLKDHQKLSCLTVNQMYPDPLLLQPSAHSPLSGLPVLPSLTSLELSALWPMTDRDLEALLAHTHLTKLWIYNGSLVSDKGLHSLGSLPRLTSLVLSRFHAATEQGLLGLCRCSGLRYIHFMEVGGLTPDVLRAMLMTVPLEVVSVSGCNGVSKEDCRLLRKEICQSLLADIDWFPRGADRAQHWQQLIQHALRREGEQIDEW